MADMTFTRAAAQTKLKKLMAELSNRGMTGPEVAVFLGLGPETAADYLRFLHARRQIYIRSWTRQSVNGLRGLPRPIWFAGCRKDAEKPAPIPNAEHCRKQYAKNKKDPVKYAEVLARAKHRQQKRVFKPRPDIAAAWIPRRDMREAA